MKRKIIKIVLKDKLKIDEMTCHSDSALVSKVQRATSLMLIILH